MWRRPKIAELADSGLHLSQPDHGPVTHRRQIPTLGSEGEGVDRAVEITLGEDLGSATAGESCHRPTTRAGGVHRYARSPSAGELQDGPGRTSCPRLPHPERSRQVRRSLPGACSGPRVPPRRVTGSHEFPGIAGEAEGERRMVQDRVGDPVGQPSRRRVPDANQGNLGTCQPMQRSWSRRVTM